MDMFTSSTDHSLPYTELKLSVQHLEHPEVKSISVIPSFKDLPLQKNHPPYSAWGLWGVDDEAGTLRFLDNETVARAGSEIKEGLRFSLNWSMSKPETPGFGRSHFPFCHTIHEAPSGMLILDDSITFNTQRSSQWDGLRHFAYQKEQLFYQGVTKQQILEPGSSILGLQNLHVQGDGIAGRGVLLDLYTYAQEVGKEYDAIGGYAITFDDLMACIRFQEEQSECAMEFRSGDILIIRCGYTSQYEELTPLQEKAAGLALPPVTCGLEQDERLLEWLWENHFAAVAGDSPSFEHFPPREEAGFLLHEVLIAGWGCQIGELLWLEDLAAACQERKRWTFFVASSPLNINGGVASPANMMAIL
ncbi:hypothetical protein PVAG01_09891 [Phlyctema vagabunda]|uniref:Cyclase n=1 Tax=Phlyctema vagabunda TaxID=108571 RepID=A0ABR4P504_9HELO